jgi:hypothetical protein
MGVKEFGLFLKLRMLNSYGHFYGITTMSALCDRDRNKYDREDNHFARTAWPDGSHNKHNYPARTARADHNKHNDFYGF